MGTWEEVGDFAPGAKKDPFLELANLERTKMEGENLWNQENTLTSNHFKGMEEGAVVKKACRASQKEGFRH